MTPLDLTRQPPRAPRAELDGLIFLPRSIDKVRASLPGGTLGEYCISGLTQMMLDALGVSVEAFTLAVSAADDDAEVAAFLRRMTTQATYDAWNASIVERRPRGGDPTEALVAYPWLKDRPDLISVLDVLEQDDKHLFAATP